MAVLWVVEDLPPVLARVPLLRAMLDRARSGAIRSWLAEATKGDILIGPASVLEKSGFSGQRISWDEIRTFATCQQREPFEALAFCRSVLTALERSPAALVNGLSVPRAMSYGLIASFSEDLPFLISGLRQLIREREVRQARTFGRGANGALVTAVSRGLQIPVSVQTGMAQSVAGKLGSILKKIAGFPAPKPANGRRTLPAEPLDVLFCLGKGRTLRYLAPVENELRARNDIRTGILSSIRYGAFDSADAAFLTDILAGGELSARLQYWQQKMQEVWDAAAAEIRDLPDTFEGVRLAPFHFDEMARVWHERAAIAALSLELGGQFLEKAKPQAVFISDPLEFSWVMAELAKRREIPRILFYPIYDGLPSTAGIWEEHIRGMADWYAPMNAWLAERIVSKGIAGPEQVNVVGDILQVVPEGGAELRKKVRQQLGLDPSRPLIVLMSRPRSSTLNAEDKRWLFESVFRAAKESGAAVVVKGHPYEDRLELEAQVKAGDGQAPVVINEIPLAQLLAAADLGVGTPVSAANLDVIYAGIPLVVGGAEDLFRRFDDQDARYAYRKYAAGLCVSSGGDLAGGIVAILRDPAKQAELKANGRRFAERVAGNMDGRAAERLAQLALAVIKRS